MKKFLSFTFAFLLMISMVALVGCNGLWDFDDDDDVTTLMPVNYKFVGKIALASATNNIRAATISDYTVYSGNVYYEGDTTTTTALNKNLITVDDAGSFTVDFNAIDGKTFYIVFTSSAGGLKLYRYFNKTKADMDNYDASNPAIVNEETTAVGIILQSDSSKKYGIDVKEEDVIDTSSDVYKLVQTITGMGDVSTNSLTVPATGVTITNADPLGMVMGGEAVELKATPDPIYTTDTLVWTIDSGAAFITLSGSTVTPVAEGTAVVKVTAGSVSDTITINVAAGKVAVTGVTLNKTATTIAVDATETLTATVAPTNATNKTVTWKSSDDTVATVDTTGKVTGVKAGTATITVTTADGSKTATCVVTVTAVVNEVATVTFDKTVSGVFDTQLKFEITGHPSTFTTTETTVAYDGGSYKYVLSPALSTDATTRDGVATLVLVTNDANPMSPKTMSDFSQLTFSPAIPKGSTVKVKNGTTVVATSNNIPAN